MTSASNGFIINLLSKKRRKIYNGGMFMYKIVEKRELNSAVTLMKIEAPFIAKKARAGQFIIFRIDDQGERVPLTIAGYDREAGTVTIIFQKVGFSTIALGNLNEGDYILDFVGPLGKPTPVEGKKKVCVVGGGVGCAIALPSAAAFKEPTYVYLASNDASYVTGQILHVNGGTIIGS